MYGIQLPMALYAFKLRQASNEGDSKSRSLQQQLEPWYANHLNALDMAMINTLTDRPKKGKTNSNFSLAWSH